MIYMCVIVYCMCVFVFFSLHQLSFADSVITMFRRCDACRLPVHSNPFAFCSAVFCSNIMTYCGSHSLGRPKNWSKKKPVCTWTTNRKTARKNRQKWRISMIWNDQNGQPVKREFRAADGIYGPMLSRIITTVAVPDIQSGFCCSTSTCLSA